VTQSVSAAHVVAQAVPLQVRYGVQLIIMPAAQLPVPLHVLAVVSVPPLHDAAAQTVPAVYFAHAPFPSQDPSVPHVDAVCMVQLLSGSVPTTTLPHVPSVPAPLCAAVHAVHVPEHAVLQQTPSAQKPLVHWVPSPPVQGLPSICAAVQTPLLQKLPAAQSPSTEQAVHTRFLQSPLAQSLSNLQSLVLAQAGQELPPQSTSVSVPSLMSSEQVAATHLLAVQASPVAQSAGVLHPTQAPAAVQTLPLLSMHAVPSDASIIPHTFAVQVLVTHFVGWAEQSLPITQATHLPLPSQTVPLLSVHAVSAAAFESTHAFIVQATVTHLVLGCAQSVAALHATQWPLPSQTVPLLSVHAVPAEAFVFVHVMSVPQETVMQTVPVAGQSVVGSVHVPPVPVVVVPPVPVPVPVPPAPPILLRSTVAMSSQPAALAASMPAATARAAKKLIL
jgi:hypothetical protein